LLAEVLQSRLPNLYSGAFGGIEDLTLQVRLSQSNGKEFINRLSPRSATGPSLKNYMIGSQKLLGIPIEATLRIFPKPQYRKAGYFLFKNLKEAPLFLQQVQMAKLFIPLMVKISAASLKKIVSVSPTTMELVGFAHWGEEKLVRALVEVLVEEASKRKGSYRTVEQRKLPSFLNLLEMTQAKHMQDRSKASMIAEKKMEREILKIARRCS
jgi:FAD/FMN-containing dehydrogenase